MVFSRLFWIDTLRREATGRAKSDDVSNTTISTSDKLEKGAINRGYNRTTMDHSSDITAMKFSHMGQPSQEKSSSYVDASDLRNYLE